MDIQRRVAPGNPGTIKYMQEYGDRLVCVRYKYDKSEMIKYKTIEIIVSKEPWTPRQDYIPMNKNVYLKVQLHERWLQRLIRSAGGKWIKEKARWRLPYGTAKSLGLEDRIDWLN
ncbi:hypothetical protein EH223_20765 [candidate division KSB1 bacterium]|nr:hypothetical protein [candidate division KSB1 bacterium]RQV99936.1 MAG: hypothetical protein EH223_20765 [candidate division KSB1 bacterium]